MQEHYLEGALGAPRFAAERREALLDFFRVFDAQYDRIRSEALVLKRSHPEFGPQVRVIPPDQLAAESARTRELLRRAIVDSEWLPYERDIRARGTASAEVGVTFASWYDVVRIVRQVLVPALVESFAASKERLSAALSLMMEFLDYGMTLISEQYIAVNRGDGFRLFVQTVQDCAIFMLDSEGRIASWNAGAQAFKGYAASEIIGKHFSIFYPEEDIENGKPAYGLRTAAAVGRFEDEGWRLRKDGSRFWAGVVITAVRNSSGDLIGFGKVTRDLTERRRAEEQRKAEEQKFRALAESAADAMVTADQRGIITYVNQAATSAFGHTVEEMVGKPLTILMPERLREAHLRGLKRFVTTGEARVLGKTLELTGLRSDRTEFPLELSLASWNAGDAVLFAAVMRDVTERKRGEQVLLQAHEVLQQRSSELEVANRELEAFSYSVAHDLRAPLRAMSGFAEVLTREHASGLGADALDCLLEIQNNAARMAALIDGLLGLSRTTRSELRPHPTDLTKLGRSVAAKLAVVEPQRAVEIVVQRGLAATIDPALAQTLIENLFQNAWKFTSNSPAPRIEFGATQSNGSRVFFVRDNGAGFDMKYVHKLFAPFQRLHSMGEFPGIGIGLATAQRIVQRHGGRIWAEGRVGSGATFYFTVGHTEGAA